MANIASSKKRWRQSLKRNERNRMHTGKARTLVALARRFILAGNVGEAESAVKEAIQALDVAAERGTVHRNNSSRRKSRLMKAFNLMVAEQTALAAEAAGPLESGKAKPAAKRRAAPGKGTTAKAPTAKASTAAKAKPKATKPAAKKPAKK